MKHAIRITILLAILLLPITSDAQFTIRIIYFQPTDAPPPTHRIFQLMLETQGFYQSELERHGYESRTFRLETDKKGISTSITSKANTVLFIISVIPITR